MKGLISNTQSSHLFLPKIELKKRLKKVIISGVSRMPDPGSYYNSLANQLMEHFHAFNNTLFVEFYFDYINSGSTKWIYSIIQHLEFLAKDGGYIEIAWKYDEDDESIELTGDVLKSQTKLPFSLNPVMD